MHAHIRISFSENGVKELDRFAKNYRIDGGALFAITQDVAAAVVRNVRHTELAPSGCSETVKRENSA